MSSPAKLPVLTGAALRPDGSRQKIHPAEVSGRFTRLQKFLYPALIAVYAALPWLRFRGVPLVFVDIVQRRFFFFGLTFNSSDFYLAFFVLSGIAFSLVVTSALFGRVWCGYACPQTVFLEGVYRRIEALVEGNAFKRLAREKGGWSVDRVARLLVKHALFILVSLIVANLFLAYFATADQVLKMMGRSPSENVVPFLWMASVAGALYFNFAWFREQMCIVLCPYGRLQSVLADPDTVVVGYDAKRGEPRAKRGTEGAGDCVDCRRCVQVCPTGIDIRNGLQLECLGCARCVDACDEVMFKIGRPEGLIRYDSQAGLKGERKRFFRPRLVGYAVATLAGVVAMGLAIGLHTPFQANLLRAQRAPYERTADSVVNRFVLHLASKSNETRPMHVEVRAPAGAKVVLPSPDLELAPFESRQLPLVVEAPLAVAGSRVVTVRTTDVQSGKTVESTFTMLGL